MAYTFEIRRRIQILCIAIVCLSCTACTKQPGKDGVEVPTATTASEAPVFEPKTRGGAPPTSAQFEKPEPLNSRQEANRTGELFQELQKLKLPDEPEVEDWIELSAKTDALTRDFFDKLFILDERSRQVNHKDFGKEVQAFANGFGKGSPSQDFIWLLSAPYVTTLPHGHFSSTVDDSYGGDVFNLRTQIAKAHVTLFLKDKVALERFAQSVAWIGQAFTPRGKRATLGEHPILVEMERLNSNGSHDMPRHDPRKRPFLRDPKTGKPTPLFWWEARLAITFRTICDSDSDLTGWKPDQIDADYRKWFKEWSAARKAGLIRPGRKFGWRVDRRKNAKPVAALPPPKIPEKPIEGLPYPSMDDDYLKTVLFSY